MKIAMISTPYVPVPPKGYGGTELVVGLITEHLVNRGHDVTLYATGDSETKAKLKSLYAKSVWPPKNVFLNPVTEIDHAAWAVQDAIQSGAEVIHMNCPLGVALQRFSSIPQVYTIHHPWDEDYNQFYLNYPEINFVAISDFQRNKFSGISNIRTIHHGLNLDQFDFQASKGEYIAFLGRIAAVKGVHLAIDAARRAGMPLKIAGDIQPIHKDYYEREVKPKIDGRLIEYIGEADYKMKVELLKGAKAMLFPIQWDEPFGLVMIESMACGTPVVAFPHGSVPEVVKDGVSGYVVSDVEQMAAKINELNKLSPRTVRDYAERNFSAERMVGQYEAAYQHAISSKQPLRVIKKSA